MLQAKAETNPWFKAKEVRDIRILGDTDQRIYIHANEGQYTTLLRFSESTGLTYNKSCTIFNSESNVWPLQKFFQQFVDIRQCQLQQEKTFLKTILLKIYF